MPDDTYTINCKGGGGQSFGAFIPKGLTIQHDKKALEELAKIAGIDVNEYGLAMLKAGTDLDDFSAEELVNLDAKKLDKDGKKFVIAQVNTVAISEVLKRQDELEKAMKEEMTKNEFRLYNENGFIYAAICAFLEEIK